MADVTRNDGKQEGERWSSERSGIHFSIFRNTIRFNYALEHRSKRVCSKVCWRFFTDWVFLHRRRNLSMRPLPCSIQRSKYFIKGTGGDPNISREKGVTQVIVGLVEGVRDGLFPTWISRLSVRKAAECNCATAPLVNSFEKVGCGALLDLMPLLLSG